MTTTDCERLFEQVCATPEDWDLRRVLADIFEDEGRQDEADCLRWMAENRKRARYVGGKEFIWYEDRPEPGRIDPNSDAPMPILSAMAIGNTHIGDVAWKREYLSRRDSELAVLAAWPVAVAAGWVPPGKEEV